ncbi:MAG: hypothetical protein JST44_14285 [Cyanobacteria bacterium SZAS LIN-5]|nr:hypothetical protein [Cyanobacteria bacterium SZAS LIN-5]
MTASFTNIHLHTDDAAAVRAALDAAEITQSKMFGRAGTPWVSVYPRATEDGAPDFDLLKAFAFSLSRHLDTIALAVMVERSANLRFALYKNGILLDEYALHPDFPDCSLPPVGGKTEVLLPLTIEGTSKKDLDILLHPGKKDKVQRDAESIAQALAHFLALPRAQVSMGFNHLKEAQAGR